MPGFFFRPVDLSSLALFFVALLVGWRLARLRLRTTAGRWLTLFFSSAALFALFSIVASARLDRWQFYATHLQIAFSALAVAALIQYVYRVGEMDPDDVEARTAWIVSLTGLLYVFGWAAYQFLQLSPDGNPSTSTAISEGLTAAGLVWTVVVALRQVRFGRAHPQRAAGARSLTMLLVAVLLLLGASVFQFVGGVLADFVPNTVYTVYAVSIAVIMIGFNYFLDWDQANTRVNRVIAAALVLLQSVFAVLAIVYGAQLNAEPAPLSVLGNHSYRMLPQDGGYLLEEAGEAGLAGSWETIDGDEELIQPDFPLIFFGKEYGSLLIRRGRLLFGEEWSSQKANYYLQPQIAVANLTGHFERQLVAEVSHSADELSVRWSLPEGETAQATIRRDGELLLIYQELNRQPIHSWGLSAGEGLDGVEFLQDFPPDAPSAVPAAGILFERAFALRQRQDAWTRPILYFQLVVSVLAVAILSAVRGRLDTLDQALIQQSLTHRQLEIAQLVAAGKSNAEIGDELKITESTVKYHLSRIFQLLNVKDRRSLADWFRKASGEQD